MIKTHTVMPLVIKYLKNYILYLHTHPDNQSRQVPIKTIYIYFYIQDLRSTADLVTSTIDKSIVCALTYHELPVTVTITTNKSSFNCHVSTPRYNLSLIFRLSLNHSGVHFWQQVGQKTKKQKENSNATLIQFPSYKLPPPSQLSTNFCIIRTNCRPIILVHLPSVSSSKMLLRVLHTFH